MNKVQGRRIINKASKFYRENANLVLTARKRGRKRGRRSFLRKKLGVAYATKTRGILRLIWMRRSIFNKPISNSDFHLDGAISVPSKKYIHPMDDPY